MNKNDFLRLLEEVIELPDHTLKGDEALEEISQWDSLAVLSFMAKIDEVFGAQMSAEAIVKARTVQQLYSLLPAT